MPEPFVEILSELERRIMKDIIERVKINGFSSATSDWQISRLQQLGESEANIRKWISETLEKTDEELDDIFSDKAYQEYYGHNRAYKIAGFEQMPFKQNIGLQTLIEAAKRQTQDTFQNMTASTSFAIRNPATGRITYSPTMEFYQKTLDAAMMNIHSGAFSYNTVLQRTISSLADTGLRWVDYDSGWHNRVDVAARRAVMTGFRQIQEKINEQVAEQLQTDQYEVTYHRGARPTHQPWQGKVWSKQELITVCGLGTVTGLHGANCYHDYRAFPLGSIRTYTDEQLEDMQQEENTPKEYLGKKYTMYEDLQRQRKMEMEMRKIRQEIRLLQDGHADSKDIMLKKAKYQGKLQAYREFSKAMGLPEQMERVYQDGLRGRFTPGKTVASSGKSDIMELADINKMFTSYERAVFDRIPPKDGYFDVAAHGAAKHIWYGSADKTITARELARIIRHTEKYNGEKIRLLSCSTGSAKNGFAQQLANALGVEVEAPSDKLYVKPDGTYWVGLRHNGKMMLFKPGKGE